MSFLVVPQSRTKKTINQPSQIEMYNSTVYDLVVKKVEKFMNDCERHGLSIAGLFLFTQI
mgnify:CR=1 FL=1